ncbi:MAG TPA: hypothetical protein VLK33_11660 [Terriglobales bacterium]|nr:hypothetical protein [Terriglobales bacterium]
MKSKILVVGFALISAFALAQSSSSKTDAGASTDAKQGQAKLKMTPEKMEAGSEAIKKTSTPVKGSSAQPMASDDWNQQHRNASPNTNGTANPATPGSSEVKAPRDVATGQASGKRQHSPVTFKTDDQQKPPSEKK